MDERQIPAEEFEIIRDHGAYLIRRNNALVARVLEAKDRARRLADQFFPDSIAA